MVWQIMMFEDFQDGCLVAYMVWKKILVKEFQNCCLVLGNLSYANDMI